MGIGAILLLGVLVLAAVALLLMRSRRPRSTTSRSRRRRPSPERGPSPEVRPLPAFRTLVDEVGYSAESGGAIHIALGSGGLYGEDAIISLAGLQVVESLADATVSYNAPPIITVGDPTLLPLAQDILRRAYERKGIAEQYNPSNVRFVAPSPVAYAAGAANVVTTENVAANVMAGAFESEVSLIADAGTRRDLTQMAAAAAPGAIGALYPVTERLAAGEELFAAGAQLTGDRRYLIGLIFQDILRVILALAIAGTAAMALIDSFLKR